MNTLAKIEFHRDVIENLYDWSYFDCEKAKRFNDKYPYSKMLDLALSGPGKSDPPYIRFPKRLLGLKLRTNIKGVFSTSYFFSEYKYGASHNSGFVIKIHKNNQQLINKLHDKIMNVCGTYGVKETRNYFEFELYKYSYELLEFFIRELGEGKKHDVKVFNFTI